MTELRSILREVFIDTLNNMGFIDVVSSDASGIVVDDDSIIAKVKVFMPFGSAFYCIMHRDTVNELAANISGSQTGVMGEVMLKDAVMEFLNAFTGSVFFRLIPGKLFELGIPESVPSGDFKPPADFEVLNFSTLDGRTVSLVYILRI